MVEWNDQEGIVKQTYSGLGKRSLEKVKFDTAKNKLLAAQVEVYALNDKNRTLKQKNATLSKHITTQMGELTEECRKIRKNIRRKGI